MKKQNHPNWNAFIIPAVIFVIVNEGPFHSVRLTCILFAFRCWCFCCCTWALAFNQWVVNTLPIYRNIQNDLRLSFVFRFSLFHFVKRHSTPVNIHFYFSFQQQSDRGKKNQHTKITKEICWFFPRLLLKKFNNKHNKMHKKVSIIKA